MKFKLRIAVLLNVTIALSAVVIGQPQYRVKLQEPLTYSYRSGHNNQLSDGSCCNRDESPPCTLGCSGVSVELCFREKGHDPRDMDTSNCPLGGMVFTPLPPNRGFRATGTVELQPTAAAITTMYPEELQVLYKIRSAQPDGLIDVGTRTLNPPVSLDKDAPVFRNYFVTGSSGITRLTINGLAIVCADGYSGSNCNVRVCVPRDDSGGHFSCDSNQNKVCLPGYQDPENNCVEPVQTTTPTESYTMSTGEPSTDSGTMQPVTRANTADPISPTTDTELPSATDRTTAYRPTESLGRPVVGPGDGGQVILTPGGTELQTQPTTAAPTQAPPRMVGVAVIGGVIAGSLLLMLLAAIVIIALVVVCLKYKTNKPVPAVIVDDGEATVIADDGEATVNSNGIEVRREFTIDRNPLYSSSTGDSLATIETHATIHLTEDTDSYYDTIDNYL